MVKMYDPYYINDQGNRIAGDMSENPFGDWVSADDFATLSARHARAIEALRGCAEALGHVTHGVRDERAENAKLAKANAVIAEEDQT